MLFVVELSGLVVELSGLVVELSGLVELLFKMDPVNWTLQFVGIPFCGHSNLSEIRGLDTNLFLRNPKYGQ